MDPWNVINMYVCIYEFLNVVVTTANVNNTGLEV
jgi:hypothetical protein